MKAFITGINGFAGSHLAEHLLSHNYNVCGSALPGTPLENLRTIENKIELIYLDIRNFDSTKDALSRTRPDQIYHLAAAASVADSFKTPLVTFEVNVFGAINLLEAVRALKNDPMILFSGSSDVYGHVPPENIPIREDYPLKPMSPYAVSKATVDMTGYQYFNNFGLKIIRTRSFNHIGPRQSDMFVISAFAKQVAEIEKGSREPVLKVGNLEAVRDFTHVKDVVSAYRLLVERGVAGEAYNVCSGKPYSISALLKVLLGLTKKQITVERDKDKIRAVDIPVLLGDNAKIKAAVGWGPTETIPHAVEETLNWWRSVV